MVKLYIIVKQKSSFLNSRAAYKRASGKCECTMMICSRHTGLCSVMLRGVREVHQLTAGVPYSLSNVVAVYQTFHRNDPGYE